MPSNITKDILQEIPEEDVECFCRILQKDWPNSIHVYYFIKTITEWRKRKANIKVSLLCMADGFEDGTFIGIMNSELGGNTLYAYTQEHSCERLTRALRQTKRILWNDQLMFEAVLQKHSPVIHNVVQEKGLETSVYSQSNILYMPDHLANSLTLRCSNGVYTAPLKLSHLPYIYSVWAHNDVYTQQELETTLRLNRGYGVFDAQDHTLLSWALHTHYGGIGVVQTRTGHQGKGHARQVVTHISRVLAGLGISPHVTVKDSNYASLSLFRSVGYQHVSSIQYITLHESRLSSDSSSSLLSQC